MLPRIFPLLLAVVLLGAAPPASAQEDAEPSIEPSGAIRFDFGYRPWLDDSRYQGGSFNFDAFLIGADGEYRDFVFDGQYRFYSGYHFLRYGFIGYAFTETLEARFGLTLVPFGVLPLVSNGFGLSLAYFVGLEDDYDVGITFTYEPGPLRIDVGYFKNDEDGFTGSSLGSARYSYDVVNVRAGEFGEGTPARSNSERDQGNLRLAVLPVDGEDYSVEVGASGQYGGLYNSETNENGDHWAVAGHLTGTAGPFNLMLQVYRYEYDPANPEGIDDDAVALGAYDAPYLVADEATGYLGNVSYVLPFEIGPVSSIKLYNDYAYVGLDDDADAQQNIAGMRLSAGPILIFLELTFAKNQPFLGPFFGRTLERGRPNEEWRGQFLANIGYYF